MKRLTVVFACALIAGCQPAAARAAGGEDADDSLEMFEALQSRIVKVAGEITPSVVYIEAILKQQNRKSQVSGSGIIADAAGRIFTNQHVVERALKVTVKVPGIKDPFPAEVVGTDRQTDLALLKIDPGDHVLRPARFGTSESLQVGQWVLAVGNPYGFDGSVSFGIVQAKGRNLQFRGLINAFIQTDALIDQGSSGGPLVNLKGEVVGINSIAAGRGMGFTIPIETALEVKKNLLSSGEIHRAWLGITFQPLSPQLAKYWKLSQPGGAIVSTVIEGSPAQRAGLAAGDILLLIGGQPVDVPDESEASSLTRTVAGFAVGQKVPVKILREGTGRTLEVVLAAQPPLDSPEHDSEWGFGYQDVTTTRRLAARLDSDVGAYVSFVERGTPADESGLAVGDVIVAASEQEVLDADDLAASLEKAAGAKQLLLTARRGKDLRYCLMERAPNTPLRSAQPASMNRQ